MTAFMTKLEITSVDEWHKISTKLLQQHGGTGLLNKYGGSFIKLLTTLYPEYKKFCRDMMLKLANEMKLSRMEDIVQIPL